MYIVLGNSMIIHLDFMPAWGDLGWLYIDLKTCQVYLSLVKPFMSIQRDIESIEVDLS